MIRNCTIYILWFENLGCRATLDVSFIYDQFHPFPPPHSADVCLLLETGLLSNLLDYLPVQSIDLRSGTISSILQYKVRLGLEINGARTQHPAAISSFQGWSVCVWGTGLCPLSEEIRASPLPVVTFRAGNYPTQCVSTLKI